MPVPVVISSGEAEYMSTPVACMRASHIRMLINDLKFMGSESCNQDVVNLDLARIIIDNEVTNFMATCNKDTASKHHEARRYHSVQRGIALREH